MVDPNLNASPGSITDEAAAAYATLVSTAALQIARIKRESFPGPLEASRRQSLNLTWLKLLGADAAAEFVSAVAVVLLRAASAHAKTLIVRFLSDHLSTRAAGTGSGRCE